MMLYLLSGAFEAHHKAVASAASSITVAFSLVERGVFSEQQE